MGFPECAPVGDQDISDWRENEANDAERFLWLIAAESMLARLYCRADWGPVVAISARYRGLGGAGSRASWFGFEWLGPVSSDLRISPVSSDLRVGPRA